MSNSFDTRNTINVNGKDYEIFQLTKVDGVERLPFSMKILLENLLRHEDGKTVEKKDIEAIINWDSKADPSVEIAYRPGACIDARLHRRACGC